MKISYTVSVSRQNLVIAVSHMSEMSDLLHLLSTPLNLQQYMKFVFIQNKTHVYNLYFDINHFTSSYKKC